MARITTLILVILLIIPLVSANAPWYTKIGLKVNENKVEIPGVQKEMPINYFIFGIMAIIAYLLIFKPPFKAVAIIAGLLILFVLLPPSASQPKLFPWTKENYNITVQETVYGIPNLGGKLFPSYPAMGWLIILLGIFLLLGLYKKIAYARDKTMGTKRW